VCEVLREPVDNDILIARQVIREHVLGQAVAVREQGIVGMQISKRNAQPAPSHVASSGRRRLADYSLEGNLCIVVQQYCPLDGVGNRRSSCGARNNLSRAGH